MCVCVCVSYQLAVGHGGDQLCSLAAQDEASQVEQDTHHRQQDKQVHLKDTGRHVEKKHDIAPLERAHI